MTRFRFVVLALCVSVAAVSAQSGGPVYSNVASIDAGVDGQPLRTFAFDAKANRLYAASDRGLFWVNVGEAQPVWKGPMFKMDIRHIEFAPELGRVFFTTVEDVGYVSVEALTEPKLFAHVRASDMTYEPTRREIYVTSRAPRVNVYDAATGEPGAIVDLPGWQGGGLEAVPGRVFLMQAKTPGLFSIDAKTHALSSFPTSEKVVTPVYIEADPSGRYIFAAYYQNIVAIDPSSGKVLGRATVPSVPAIAFDPGTNLLVATWADEPTPVRVAAFRVEAGGLTEVSQFRNPRVGAVGVEPTSRGFIQLGINRLYLWSAKVD
ncbi:MAG: hypothetical protein EPO35_03855 [Acidobacteria bacterium]|nr:MAG: hypothetical protein EPO35_03855 [Acidobacteriota bacterium]